MIRMRVPTTAANWRQDWPARILAAICVLNLNGLFSMMFDVEQAASVVMLGTAIILILQTGRYAWSLPFNLLMAAIGSYLFFGLLFYDPVTAIDPASSYMLAYAGSILVIWALAGYVSSLTAGPRSVAFLRFLRSMLLVSSASVWASPILYKYYVNLPISSDQRMGGFFGNPNEAAIVSVLAVGMTLVLPFRKRIIQISAILMASISVLMTFSKTGMTCLVVLVVWHFIRNTRGIRFFLLCIGALAAVLFIQNPNAILHTVVENPALDLDAAQKSRIEVVGEIFGGRIDEQTSTGRTDSWQLAIQRSWEEFPWGGGFDTGHHLVGGILELGVWQGAHNTFLMMWREGGVLPPLLLIAFILTAVVFSFRYARGQLEFTCLFILLVDMMASHGALATRYHVAMLGVVLGLLASALREHGKGQPSGRLSRRGSNTLARLPRYPQRSHT